jgi:hypothetical protein
MMCLPSFIKYCRYMAENESKEAVNISFRIRFTALAFLKYLFFCAS